MLMGCDILRPFALQTSGYLRVDVLGTSAVAVVNQELCQLRRVFEIGVRALLGRSDDTTILSLVVARRRAEQRLQ